jgi:tRNA 2-thiouridine synthesizing protein D
VNLTIAVHGAPYSSQASATALRFVRAAIGAGHEVHRVFFYHDGVHTASALAVAPQDEPSSLPGWVELANDHEIELAVCIAAALKRGVINEQERDRYDLPGSSAHPSFAIVGLGQLIEAICSTDRFVTFAP